MPMREHHSWEACEKITTPRRCVAGAENPAEAIRRHSRSFALAARFLPRRVRDPIQQLYAWCRTVDDAVDRAADAQSAQRELQLLRDDIRRIERGEEVLHPASDLIAPLIRDHGVDPQHALDLIEGMQLDLDGFEVRSEADLRVYCYHAAGSVGLMMASIMGCTDPAAKRPAIALGTAMQLTNIARDVAEDAARGRSYLPGLAVADLSDQQRVKTAVTEILRLAETFYGQAARGISLLPPDCRAAIRVALAVYREIGREILRCRIPVLQRRVVLPRWRLLTAAALAVVWPPGVSWSFKSAAIKNCASPAVSATNHSPKEASRDAQSCVVRKTSRKVRITGNVPLFYPWLRGVPMQPASPPPSTTRQAKHAVCVGLSLTCWMAAALFIMVYFNPKNDAYGGLPLVYALGAAIVGATLHFAAGRLEEQPS